MNKTRDEWGQLSTTCPYIKDRDVKVGSLFCQECASNLTKVNSNAEWVKLTIIVCSQE